jgi:uncharacterized protein (TIGR00369 family)
VKREEDWPQKTETRRKELRNRDERETQEAKGGHLGDTIRLEPKPTNKCFGCGGANDGGMKLAFEQDNANRKIVGRFVLGERYQGGGGVAHGGIIATLLDEAMGKVCRFREVRAVTAELTVEYLKPVNVEHEIVVEAFEQEQKGRNLFHVGEIRSAAGEVLARGRGRFVIISQAESGQVEKSPAEKKSLAV